MLELQLKKKLPPGTSSIGPHTTASVIGTMPPMTSASGDHRPPLTTMASLEGYQTDTSSVLGGLGGPMITISQPNGRKGTLIIS